MDALTAFGSVDFQWTQTLASIWRDSPYDVPSLHHKERQAVMARLASMAASPETDSPLGWVFVAAAGFGKTHLLSAIRREALHVEANFVLVDMTDVRDFWRTVLLGFIDSLQKPAGAAGRTQGQLVIQHIVDRTWGADGEAFTRELASLRPPKLANVMAELVRRLARTQREKTMRHADTLRALVLLNSDVFELSNLGNAWLQGYGVNEDAREVYGFDIGEKEPSNVVEGLSWLLSLRGPTAIALDQLDAIVTENNILVEAGRMPEEHAAQQAVSRSIIERLGRGLMELRDVTSRSLALVSCLEDTWDTFKKRALEAITDRYEAQRALKPLPDRAPASPRRTRRGPSRRRPSLPSLGSRPASFSSAASITAAPASMRRGSSSSPRSLATIRRLCRGRIL